MVGFAPRLTLITLGVQDMVVMRGFYERLGLTASSASNAEVTFFQLPGIVLGLFGNAALAEDAHMQAGPVGKPSSPQFRGVSLAWNVGSRAEADQVMKHADACGARITKPAQEVFWGGYSGYFLDPEDHLWEVAHNPFFPFDDQGFLQLPRQP